VPVVDQPFGSADQVIDGNLLALSLGGDVPLLPAFATSRT